jgi:hypothetical protein
MKTHKLIRGARLLQWLEEAPFSDLERGTMQFEPPASPDARQNAKMPIQILKMQLVPAPHDGNLTVKSVARSNSGNVYQPSIMFDEVEFQEQDMNTNVTFSGVDNKDYHIMPINLRNNNAKVHCNCLDFYWRFGKHNAGANSLLGEPGGSYVKKTDRPPANIKQTPGVCKHLLRLVDELKRNRIAH